MEPRERLAVLEIAVALLSVTFKELNPVAHSQIMGVAESVGRLPEGVLAHPNLHTLTDEQRELLINFLDPERLAQAHRS